MKADKINGKTGWTLKAKEISAHMRFLLELRTKRLAYA
jgi:hypothetical protein